MNDSPSPSQTAELREQILKKALVRSAVQRWKKYPGKPIEASHQEIVEVGIDDLMQLIAHHQQQAVIEARIDELDFKEWLIDVWLTERLIERSRIKNGWNARGEMQ